MADDIYTPSMEDNSNEDFTHDLKTENEIMKLKMQAEFGAVIGSAEDIPPEIEHQFLRNVYEFEQAWKNRPPQITIYEKLGKPKFFKAEELSDEEISKELDRFEELFEKNQIRLDFVAEYEDRLMYKFITEEFFLKETDNLKLPGFISGFIYEEYHPNHDFDLRRYTKEFIQGIVDKDMHCEYNQLHNTISNKKGEFIDKPSAHKKIMDFCDHFDSFELRELEIHSVCFNEESAVVTFNLNFDGVMENLDRLNLVGIGSLHYIKYMGEFWQISQINLPWLMM
jgi:hypothetical protein